MIKHYTMKLKVISPVFIGSGQVLDKIDYYYDDDGLHILNKTKLQEFILKNNLYDEYLETVENEVEQIVTHRKGKYAKDLINEFYKRYVKDKNDLIEYSFKIKIPNRLNRINTFIKDIYNQPYIPGSSIKGAIVSALKQEFNVEKIEGIYVSDTNSVDTKNLIIIRRKDKVYRNNEKKERILSVYNECLNAGAELTFKIDLDLNKINSSIGGNKINGIQDILHYIQKRFENIKSIFDLTGELDKYLPNQNDLLFLGGGTGLHTKLFFDYNAHIAVKKAKELLISKNKFRKHRHDRDDIISPRTLKVVDVVGKELLAGLVKLEVIN